MTILATTPTSGGSTCAEAQGPDPIQGTGAPPHSERRPSPRTEAPQEVSPTTTIIARTPVVAYQRHRVDHDSDATLAAELAAARVALLDEAGDAQVSQRATPALTVERQTNSEAPRVTDGRFPRAVDALLSIRVLPCDGTTCKTKSVEWLVWAGQTYGCPCVEREAS